MNKGSIGVQMSTPPLKTVSEIRTERAEECEIRTMRKKITSLLSLFCFFVLFGGCKPYGEVVYQIIYPSGYARDCYTRDVLTPIEGTNYQIGWQETEGSKDSGKYDLQILDDMGEILFVYQGLGSRTMRGVAGPDGTVWLCSERWSSVHYNGYRSGDLKESVLLLVNMENGEILFSQELEENELYLTSVGTKCYFYYGGKEAEEKLFGLYKIPKKDAEIYYRDNANWSEKVFVYGFDYVEWPDDMDNEASVEERIRFYVNGREIVVAFTTYEQTEKQTNKWEYIEKLRVAIPLE